MPTPNLLSDYCLPLLDASSFPVAQTPAPAGARGLDALRAEIHATLDALIEGDILGNEDLLERELRLCAEIGRSASYHSATPEFRQAVGLLRVLRATAQSREPQSDASVA